MSGLAYFFKPKINATDAGTTSSSASEKRAGRRSKPVKSSEAVEKSTAPMEVDVVAPPAPPTPPPPPPPPTTEVDIVQEEQPEQLPTLTPKIKLKFNLRSQSVQDTSDDRAFTDMHADDAIPSSDEESSDNDTRLKIDDHNGNLDGYESPLQPMPSDPTPMAMLSPTKKKPQSSRKKVISHLIGTSASTLTLDDPSPIKIPPNESQFSEVKQTKSGRTIKYTPYFKELVQGASISPPSSPVHASSQPKRASNYSKKKQTSIKADLDAIKNGGLPTISPSKAKKAGASPKVKKLIVSPAKRAGQSKKQATPKSAASARNTSKRASNQAAAEEEVQSDNDDDENGPSQLRSDDDEFRNEGQSSDEEEDDDEGLDADEDRSSGRDSDEEEWTTVGTKFDHDRSLELSSTLGSISSEMLDGYSLWAMKYRTRHRAMALDDKRLYRTWKKMSAHDRQRWCLKAEKENYHYPIAAELLKGTSSTASDSAAGNTATKSSKASKRKKVTEDHPPILLQKTLNQYSKQQTSISSIRPPNAFVKQAPVPAVVAPPKNYDVVDIAAGIYLLGESLTKMGEKVRQLGHLNPRGTSAATSIDNLSAILFDGTLCACNLMACLGNEIVSTNPGTSKSDPLTNKLMENVGIILPGLN